MPLRALSPLDYFPYDVPMEKVHSVPNILAVSEHAILWRQKSEISVNSTEFPVVARRLLRQDPLSNPSVHWLATSQLIPHICRLFLTPLAPMSSRQLAHHATCVLPVPVPINDEILTTAAFATATRLFVPIAAFRRGLAIVSFTSSSPLFDGDVTFEVSMHIHFTDCIPYDLSLTVEEPGPLSGPDQVCLLSYETWVGRTYKRCAFRYLISASTGEVTSKCVMEHPVDRCEIHCHGGNATKQIAGITRRCLLSNDDLNCLKSERLKPLQEHRIFDPVKLFTNTASREELTILLRAPVGGWTVISMGQQGDGSNNSSKFLLECSVSAASSRAGRFVVRIANIIYMGFFGGALPRLEEAGRASCYAQLSEQQKQSLHEEATLDFNSFLQFCATSVEDTR